MLTLIVQLANRRDESADRINTYGALFEGCMTLEEFKAHVDERDRRLGYPWAPRVSDQSGAPKRA